MSKGKICLFTSAFVYGIAPILAKFSYSEGVNSVTLTFLRTALMIPVLLILLMLNHTSVKISGREIGQIALLGSLGGALPIILLYISYDYISVGLASTLHFIYPLITVLANSFIYHERLRRSTLGAVVLVTIGIFMFTDITTHAESLGVILALLSGVFYSFFVIYIDRSGLDTMNYVKLTFYIMAVMSLSTLIFGVSIHQINFSMNLHAWIDAILISVLITFLATPLFQVGVRYEGSGTAAIFSAAEPVITIAAGALFLGEHMGLMQLLGVIIIFGGLFLVCKS